MMLAASTISLWDGFLELCGKLSGYVEGDFYKMEGGEGLCV